VSSSDTIAAIATAPGIGAIGIVRISGPLAPLIAHQILGRAPAARQAHLATFEDTEGNPIDQGLVLFFPGPRSFTGEDILEIQGHGGPVVLDQVLRRVLARGARLARPGEFSERAFLNGRLDLTQAEAIADLIASATAAQARLAARSLTGAFSRRVQALSERLTHTRVHLEATLDFPDEEIDPDDERAIRAAIDEIRAETAALAASARQGELIRDGLHVVIAGPPNAGKSSLLNALSAGDTAIVTPIAGTTRDLLRVDLQIDGLPLRLVDTAGLRPTDDPVEREGVRRAEAAIANADLLLWIEDDRGPYHPLPAIDPPPAARVRIRNKIDLTGRSPGLDRPAQPKYDPSETEIALSVRSGEGLDLLRQHIKQGAGYDAEAPGDFSARRRHLEALRITLSHLDAAAQGAAAAATPDLIAEDLRQAQRALGEITGEVSPDDLLGRIFAGFCIGK
jgi:tRNA modification GTPase